MKSIIGMVVLLLVFVGADASSQSVASMTQMPDTLSLILAQTRADRAGIAPLSNTSAVHRANSASTVADTTLGYRVTTRIIHTVVGGVLGGVGGGATGVAVGAYIDSHEHNDATVSAALLLGIFGAIGGLGLGLIIGALWPVH